MATTNSTDPFAGIAQPVSQTAQPSQSAEPTQQGQSSGTTDPFASIAQPVSGTTSAPDSQTGPQAAPSFTQNVGTGLKKAGEDIYNTVTSVAPPTNTNAAQTIPGKALGLAEDVATGVNNLTGITTVTNSLKNAAHMFDAYEKARQGGASITQALGAANERGKQADAITPAIEQRVKEFKANPTAETTRALGDIIATAGTIFGLHKLATPSIPTEAAPEVEADADASQPLETKTSQAVGKVKGDTGIPEGRTASSDVEVKQAVADQTQKELDRQFAAGKEVQANLQTGLKETWNQVADDNQVPRPKAGTSIREAGQQVGDSIYARSKAAYKLVDDSTGGKFQPNEDALKNVNLKLRDITGTDDAKEADLMAQKQRLLYQQDKLFNEAEKNGVPKETIDAAKSDFKTAQSIYDINHHVRMTTTGLPPGIPGAAENPEIVKSGNLMNRLVKDYAPQEGGKPGRLTQAVGDENAHSLLSHTSAAQVAENKLAASVIDNNPEFSTLPATESKALREIIRPRVTAGKLHGTNVDWKGALDDFNKLTPEELKARFSNPSAIREALRKQASIHTAKIVAGSLGSAAVLGGAGKVGWDLAH